MAVIMYAASGRLGPRWVGFDAPPTSLGLRNSACETEAVMRGGQMIRGSCLCGDVAYEIDGKYSDIGQCHCFKCRKVSGSNSNAVILTAARSLRWLRGVEQVVTYEMSDGWKSRYRANPFPANVHA